MDTIKPRKTRQKTESNLEGDNKVEYDFEFNDEFDSFPDITIPEIPDIQIPDFDVHFPDHSLDQDFDHNWDKFQEEFNTEFSERFGDFFNRNQEELHNMMEKLREKNGDLFSHQSFDQANLLALQEKVNRLQEKMMQEHGDKLRDLEHQLREWQHVNMDRMEEVQQRMLEVQKNMMMFQDELIRQLIEDGYIESAQDLKEVRWDNGVLKINGREIDIKDRGKYEELRKARIHWNNNDK